MIQGEMHVSPSQRRLSPKLVLVLVAAGILFIINITAYVFHKNSCDSYANELRGMNIPKPNPSYFNCVGYGYFIEQIVLNTLFLTIIVFILNTHFTKKRYSSPKQEFIEKLKMNTLIISIGVVIIIILENIF